MFCPSCGTGNDQEGSFCENCGTRLSDVGTQNVVAPESPAPFSDISPAIGIIPPAISSKDKGTLILLSCFGVFGLDRFYRGQTGLGLAKLITMGGCGIWSVIDLFSYILGGLVQDSDGRWIVDKKTLELLKGLPL